MTLQRWQIWTLAILGVVLLALSPAPAWIVYPVSFVVGFSVAAWERKYRRSR